MLGFLGMVLLVSMLWSCQGFLQKALPVITDIIIKVIDAEQQLDAAEQGAAAYLKQQPDPAAEAKIEASLERVKTSLRIALREAQVVQISGEGSSQQAFEELQGAWAELIDLLTETGVVGDDGALVAGPSKGLQLQQPLALMP
jgi:hypothetical protein